MTQDDFSLPFFDRFVNVVFHLEDDVERTVYFSDAKGAVQLNWLGDDVRSITNYDDYGDRSVADCYSIH